MHPCLVTGTFLNTLKFRVKDCNPETGEPDDDVGFDDEYVVRRGFFSTIVLCMYVARQHSVSALQQWAGSIFLLAILFSLN